MRHKQTSHQMFQIYSREYNIVTYVLDLGGGKWNPCSVSSVWYECSEVRQGNKYEIYREHNTGCLCTHNGMSGEDIEKGRGVWRECGGGVRWTIEYINLFKYSGVVHCLNHRLPRLSIPQRVRIHFLKVSKLIFCFRFTVYIYSSVRILAN